MERKLYYGIMAPGAVITVAFGITLIFINGWATYANTGWMHTKLALIIILIGYHLYCGRLLKAFKEDRNQHSHVFYRWFNEFPVLLLISIIILVVIKP